MAETPKATRRATTAATTTTAARTKPAAKSRPKAQGAFTEDEVAAMQEHAAEVKVSRSRSGKAGTEDDAKAVIAKIAEMDDADRVIAERLHELITTTAPELAPKLWYGMPAYARDGKIVCFFQDARKFKYRYATLGFQDAAHLDDGAMWPTSYAVAKLTTDVEKQVVALVRQAMG
jgi:uncharacterized protein YdhG (YjbR/CyaY superfamily)